MILELRIKNFLSFREEQILSFEASTDKDYESQYCIEVKEGVKLLKLGIIYGANASGKTNVLKALDFIRDFIINQKKDKSVQTGHIPFLFDEKSEHDSGEFLLSFYINKIKYIYTLVIDKRIVHHEKLVYYPSIQPAIFFERNFDTTKEKSIVTFGKTINLSISDKKVIEGLTINNSSVFSAFAKANVEKSAFDEIYNWFKDNFMKIVRPNTDLFGWTSSRVEKNEKCKDFVLEVLQKADFNISSIQIKEEEIAIDNELESKILDSNLPTELKEQVIQKGILKAKDISFIHKTELIEKTLPRFLESNGTIRYYGLGGILNKLLSNNSFLLIDELENSLHYELVSHFIKSFLLNSENSQLLFTTHDINLLNEDFLRRDSVWFVNKNKFGASEIYSLLDFKLHKNLSPFNAYKVGKLGAKPEFGDMILSKHDKNKQE